MEERAASETKAPVTEGLTLKTPGVQIEFKASLGTLERVLPEMTGTRNPPNFSPGPHSACQ